MCFNNYFLIFNRVSDQLKNIQVQVLVLVIHNGKANNPTQQEAFQYNKAATYLTPQACYNFFSHHVGFVFRFMLMVLPWGRRDLQYRLVIYPYLLLRTPAVRGNYLDLPLQSSYVNAFKQATEQPTPNSWLTLFSNYAN